MWILTQHRLLGDDLVNIYFWGWATSSPKVPDVFKYICCYFQVLFIRRLFSFFFMLLLLLCSSSCCCCCCCCCCFVNHICSSSNGKSMQPPKNATQKPAFFSAIFLTTKPRRRAALSPRQQLFHQSCGYTLATSFWFHLSRGGFLDPYKWCFFNLHEWLRVYLPTWKP